VEFIGQQTRHIVDTLNDCGHKITQIYLSGGQCRNHLLTDLMATATGLPIIIPKYIDAAVVLGSAFLGAKAAHP
jgi:ribulose kinase